MHRFQRSPTFGIKTPALSALGVGGECGSNDRMSEKRRTTMISTPPSRRDRGADVLMAEIRRFARQVAERFQPDMIILFGSHAYGTLHSDSDVDILVIMPARNQHDQAVKIRLEIPVPFPMDLPGSQPEKSAMAAGRP